MRKRRAHKRSIAPDPRYGDQMVTSFVNNLMLSGKKSVALKTFYDAMDIVKEKSEESELDVFKKALSNATPQVEVRSKRVGGATFQIPTEIRASRKISIGMKWMIKFARQRSGKGMPQKLAAEILAAAKNEGAAVKRKDEMHRMAESNKAFSHFRV